MERILRREVPIEEDEKAAADVDAEAAAKLDGGSAAKPDDARPAATVDDIAAAAAAVPRFRVIEETVIDIKVVRVAALQASLNALPVGASDVKCVYFTRSREGPLPVTPDGATDDSIADFVEYGTVAEDTLKALEVVVQVRNGAVLHGAQWALSGFGGCVIGGGRTSVLLSTLSQWCTRVARSVVRCCC